MFDIVLCTLNARYVHPSLGLRYVHAALGALRERAVIREFHLKQGVDDIVDSILRDEPAIVGVGLYIWNIDKAIDVLRRLRTLRSDLFLVVGGPEASYEYETTAWYPLVDYVVCGEGEESFAWLAARLLKGERPSGKVISPKTPLDLQHIELPYSLYSEEDCSNKMIYAETSRGCPFRCAFCLSALEPRVREFPLDSVLDALSALMARGARRFKFVDRTFNLGHDRVSRILAFFRTRVCDGMEVHFEIVPDRLDAAFIDAIAGFPAGVVRLEAGIQSIHPDTLAAIGRLQDNDRALENVRMLRERTGATIHADLVAGLPYETWESFGAAFNRVLAVHPHEIQVGVLKRLRGVPLNRLIEPCRLVFAQEAPYEILETHCLDRGQLARIKRFARYFELYHNTGHFPCALPILLESSPSAFDAFMAFSDALWRQAGRTHAIPLADRARYLYEHLCAVFPCDTHRWAGIVEEDFRRVPGRRDKLDFA